MKNIYEILKTNGIEIPEDKKEGFEKELNENYKTINEVEGLRTKLTAAETASTNWQTKYNEDIKKRDDDLTTLKTQLQTAGQDATKMKEIQDTLTALQNTYNTETAKYKQQLESQRYEFEIKELTNNLKFTSNSAKKAFLQDLLANPLSRKDDKLIGFDDFVKAYKESDEGAFVKEEPNTPNQPNIPNFLGKSNPGGVPETPKDTTKERPVIW